MTTVDGGLTALDVNGQILWQYDKGEPLFSSSLSQVKVCVCVWERERERENNKPIKFITLLSQATSS